ncbi:hypothetical protein [Metabacillus halosaccharovorans]|uniref:hypothetical protein n=1 Tax=Metabacillus halosaccharovorans TaxID=930124 RepID=UPI001C1FC7E5|nr:hypothetical protein [Metabacillus halosaccharovorans]MBU7593237.1 hypothetical protein [Metabacillus halosaccharovorans]
MLVTPIFKGERKIKYNEVQIALKKFKQLLARYPDKQESAFYFANFVKQFLRIKSNDSELLTQVIITLIKQEKPIVFYELRIRGDYDSMFDFFVHLIMDYNLAKDKFEEILTEEKKKVSI